jgi:WD40 repeat protein
LQTLLPKRDLLVFQKMLSNGSTNWYRYASGDPLCIAFDGELLAVGTSSGAVVAWNVAEGYAAWKGYHAGAVAALASVPGEPARLVSGGADRAVLLWDKEGRVMARLELGAAVTALSVGLHSLPGVR